MDKDKRNKALKLLLKLALSAVAVFIIINKVDFSKTLDYFGDANLFFLLLAGLSFFFSKVISAYRINAFYTTQELFLPQRLNLKLYFLGMFYNLFIPLVGGEGYKVFWLNKHYDAKVKKMVWVSLLDRLSGVVALTSLAALLFYFASFDSGYNWLSWILIPILYIGHYFFMRLFFNSYNGKWMLTSIHSLGVQLLQVATTFFILMSMGIEANTVDYLFVFLLSCFAYILPMIGAREMAFIFGAEYMGLDKDLSLAIGIIFYICLAINSLMGSYFLYKPLTPEKASS